MLSAERHLRITDALASRAVVATDELARLCTASAETIRRDLMILEGKGVLIRVHGGAALVRRSVSREASFGERSDSEHDAKVAIGRAAATLVKPDDTVLLDIGTTALEVARALPATFSGLVATCSLIVAAELAGRAGMEVIVSGGRVRAGDLALSNTQTVSFFENLNADVAFLGSGGIDADRGVTDFYLDEVAARRVMIERTGRCYVLADSSKFGRVAPHQVCDLASVTGLITEKQPDQAFLSAAEGAGLRVIAA